MLPDDLIHSVETLELNERFSPVDQVSAERSVREPFITADTANER